MMEKILDALKNEEKRQKEHIELIASENFVSDDVLKMQGSILTNKYAEGYPKKRYYGGCKFVDVIEDEAISALKELFKVEFANVQPHSGSQANMAVYMALLKPGDLILGMQLNAGGHLTHGYNLSFSGTYYKSCFYGVDKETEEIDMEEVRKIAHQKKPKLIVAGASSYSRIINFEEFRKIADEINAYLMVDMAHIAGLVAANLHPSPVNYAHVITSTTHKTLRGPRGGFILTNDEKIAKKIDKAVFPGIQGGPLMHVIAAKAVAFKEALSDSFKKYQTQILKNTQTLCDEFRKRNYRIISKKSENHLLLLDIKEKFNITGKKAEEILGKVNITINKNSIPFDEENPNNTSGIRLGTPALTTRGLKENEMVIIARLIDEALKNRDNIKKLEEIKVEVIKMMEKYPLFKKEE